MTFPPIIYYCINADIVWCERCGVSKMHIGNETITFS